MAGSRSGAIASWLGFLESLDSFDDVVGKHWRDGETHDIPSDFSTTGLRLAAWIADHTSHDPAPMLDLMRAVQANDPLGHMAAFKVPVDEVDKLRWRWWPIKEILIDKALAAMATDRPLLTSRRPMAEENDSAPPEPDYELPLITIDHEQLRVIYGRHNLKVTGKGAIMLQAIVDANGEWVSNWSTLTISKPSDVKKNLPRLLRDLIETKPGSGYRFYRKPLKTQGAQLRDMRAKSSGSTAR